MEIEFKIERGWIEGEISKIGNSEKNRDVLKKNKLERRLFIIDGSVKYGMDLRDLIKVRKL